VDGKAVGLNHVSVCAVEMEASLRFYEDVLGLERVPTPNFGFPVQWLRTGDLQVHLFQRGERYEAPSFNHFGLTIDDFMAVYRRVRALGIQEPHTFYSAVYELPDGGVQMYVRDPAGNLVELDHPHASTVIRDEVPEYRVLANDRPQDAGNREATLFLALREEREESAARR
jgi:catechol 2,3-dioxygenase-like lactoylglutathione lyase family enzyme